MLTLSQGAEEVDDERNGEEEGEDVAHGLTDFDAREAHHAPDKSGNRAERRWLIHWGRDEP